MRYAKDIYSDHLSQCKHISNAIPSNLLDGVFSHLLTMKWYSNRKYETLWFIESPCNCSYEYSGYNIRPTQMPTCVQHLKRVVEDITGAVDLNSCNANLYQGASNTINWHTDDEDLFLADRQKSFIVSVSLGADRDFCIKSRANGSEIPITLSNGDICTMEGFFQKFFLHCILPHASPTSVRINLTFRKIVLHTHACPLRGE